MKSNAPAIRAGIVPGDIITSVNGQPIKDSREHALRVAALSPGATVRLGVIRNGSQKSVSVTLGAIPQQQ